MVKRAAISKRHDDAVRIGLAARTVKQNALRLRKGVHLDEIFATVSRLVPMEMRIEIGELHSRTRAGA